MRLTAATVLALAAIAFGGDDPGLKAHVESSLARGDRAGAVRAIEEAAAADPASRLDAARTAFDVLQGADGNLLAARLVAQRLEKAPEDGDAILLAARLRERLLRDADVAAGCELLPALRKLRPEDPDVRRDLARLLRYAGRREEARDAYSEIVRLRPADEVSRLQIASIEEELGNPDRAVAIYDDILRRLPRNLDVYLLKARMLRYRKADCAGARAALESGIAAANSDPPLSGRDDSLSRFDAELRAIAEQERHREELRGLGRRIDRLLAWTIAGWLAVLGGGVVLLRRARWL